MAAQVTLESAAEARPGAVARCDLRVRNVSGLDDRFRFEVTGEVASWATVTPATLELGPTGEGVVQVVLSIPRSPWPAAGALPLDVKVSSRAEPRRTTVAQGVVRIAPFRETTATVIPALSHGRHRAQHVVTVHNRGNTPLRARISLARSDRGFGVRVEPGVLSVAPGRCEAARVRVLRRAPGLWGSPKRGSFALNVEADGTTPVRIDAAMQQEPAGWALRCGTGLGLALLLAVASIVISALA